ncbi:MAG: SDR family oxidoreductase [Candidatus Promineifilaceae bacterium]
MKLLITGGSSYLGQHLVPLACQTHEVLYSYFSNDPLALDNGVALDVRDSAAVSTLVAQYQPDAIIHLAGSNRTPDMANVIVMGAQNMVAAAQSADAKLIHLSSDVVFDGSAAPYDESAETAPVHAYGRAKADAEKIIATYSNHVIVRTSLIYSLRLIDNGTRWMRQAIAENNPPTLFNNHYRNPIYADDLSLACLELAGNTVTGRINLVGAQTVLRSGFARKLLTHWGVPIHSVKDAPDETGRFPKDLRMEIKRAQAVLQTRLRGVDEVLKDVS